MRASGARGRFGTRAVTLYGGNVKPMLSTVANSLTRRAARRSGSPGPVASAHPFQDEVTAPDWRADVVRSSTLAHHARGQPPRWSARSRWQRVHLAVAAGQRPSH